MKFKKSLLLLLTVVFSMTCFAQQSMFFNYEGVNYLVFAAEDEDGKVVMGEEFSEIAKAVIEKEMKKPTYDKAKAKLYKKMKPKYVGIAQGNTQCSGDIVIPEYVYAPTDVKKKNPIQVAALAGEAFFKEGKGGAAITSITLPASIKKINKKAFRGCKDLRTVTLSDNVTAIGDFAFFECKNLSSINIGDNIEVIGHYAFAGCESLTSIVAKNPKLKLGVGAFQLCSSLKSFEANINSVPQKAFNGCVELSSVKLGASFSKVSAQSFAYCLSLPAYEELFASVTKIGRQAFYGCSFDSVALPKNKQLDLSSGAAFQGCTIKTFVMPEARQVDGGIFTDDGGEYDLNREYGMQSGQDLTGRDYDVEPAKVERIVYPKGYNFDEGRCQIEYINKDAIHCVPLSEARYFNTLSGGYYASLTNCVTEDDYTLTNEDKAKFSQVAKVTGYPIEVCYAFNNSHDHYAKKVNTMKYTNAADVDRTLTDYEKNEVIYKGKRYKTRDIYVKYIDWNKQDAVNKTANAKATINDLWTNHDWEPMREAHCTEIHWDVTLSECPSAGYLVKIYELDGTPTKLATSSDVYKKIGEFDKMSTELYCMERQTGTYLPVYDGSLRTSGTKIVEFSVYVAGKLLAKKRIKAFFY